MGVGLHSLLKMKQLDFFWILSSLSSFLARSQAQSLCPTEPACLGCPTRSRIICSSGGLTGFPSLPPDLQQDVQELRLTNNGITRVMVEDLVNYTSLSTLSLSFNSIQYIEPGSFNQTMALREIDLSSNQLTSLPDELFANTSLTSLSVSNNQIEVISAAMFIGLRDFSTINLDGNRIQTIPDGTFSEIGRIEQLILTNNPLVCDCHLRWLPGFVDSSSMSAPLISTLGTCTVPVQNLTDVAVDSLATEEFECDCSPPCVNGECNMITGQCECSDGFTGDDCSSACPERTYGADCSLNCTCVVEHESSPCDNVNGTCQCLPGYSGSSCEMECQEGFYGQDCEEMCQCQNGASCDFRTGTCNCTAGWMGQVCNLTCLNGTYGRNCSQQCLCRPEYESTPCNGTDGTCYCDPGYTGTTCDEDCPEGSYGQDCIEDCECQNGAVCDSITGECNCTSGWMGERCDESCTDGFYGANCNQSCTCKKEHQSRPCDAVSGECHCLANYTGQDCELPLPPVQSTTAGPITLTDPDITPGEIVGVVIGGIAVALIIIAVVVLVILICWNNIFLCHKTRQVRLKISPSSPFEMSEAQNKSVQELECPVTPPPSYDQIQPCVLPEIIVTTETLPDKENLTNPL